MGKLSILSSKDYNLLINICYQALRSYNLTSNQANDISNMIDKLNNLRLKKEQINAVVDGKKMGKRTGV